MSLPVKRTTGWLIRSGWMASQSLQSRGLAGFLCLMWLQFAAIEVRAQTVLHTETEIYPSARLVELDQSLNWKFAVAEQSVTLASTQVVRWGAWAGVTRNSAVWLSDGSWLVGDLQIATPDKVTLSSDWFQPVSIPLRSIRGLVRVAPASIAAWNRLQQQLESTSGGRDIVWLAADRQVAGIVRIELNEPPDTGAVLAIENAAQTIRLDWAEVQTLVFSPALMGKLPALTDELALGLVDGSHLQVRKLNHAGESVRLTLVCGLELTSLDLRTEFSAGVSLLTSPSPRSTFLGNMEPANYRNISHTRIEWPLGTNRDLYGRPLMTEWGIVDRGIAVHSSSQVAYRWDGSRARLLAEVMLAKPPEVSDRDLGSVGCQVLLARNGKLESVKKFSVSRDSSQPILLNIDLTDAQLIALVTEQGDFGPYGDHLLWLEARIAKSLVQNPP